MTTKMCQKKDIMYRPTNGDSLQDIDVTEKYGITVNKKVPLCLQPIAYNNFEE